MLLPSFAQQESSLIQEEVSLHRFEASQLFHACGTSLMTDPDAERALHQHPAQLTDVPLSVMKGGAYVPGFLVKEGFP